MIYEVRELGTLVRCPSCDNALIRFAHNRSTYPESFDLTYKEGVAGSNPAWPT